MTDQFFETGVQTNTDAGATDASAASTSPWTAVGAPPRRSGTERYLTLTDMTSASGCTARTVRYYEREGLLRALRSGGGHRLFAREELDRLNYIVALREAGWSLEEIAEFLDLRVTARTGREAHNRIEASIASRLGGIEEKIRVLSQLHEDLVATRAAFAVCRDCTHEGPSAEECRLCGKVAPQDNLPRGFRLTWHNGQVRTVKPGLPVVR
ncbi:MAG: MerR family transcriptional regulator [Myxococcales bacterium]|nr:MerR family transcriptional regulator [Myxococcales bacterium]